MKGIINKGIQEFVEAEYGESAWAEIMEKAGCDEPFFSASHEYPDKLTADLVGASSTVSGLSVDTIFYEFGKYWVSNTAFRSYPVLFNLAGKTAREFLIHISQIHALVRNHLPGASPPSFELEKLPDGRLLMRYRSDRRLCRMLEGLIVGVGIHFDEEIQVKETSCMKDGASCCTMEVTFP